MAGFRLDFQEPVTSILADNTSITEVRAAKTELELNLHREALQSLTAIQQSLSQIEQLNLDSHAQLQGRVGDLAYQVIKSCVSESHELSNEIVKKFADCVCAEFKPVEPESIRVHPQCVPAIQDWKDASNMSLEIIADANISPGDCLVETADRGMAARLDDYAHEALKS